jgi:hypothetical protein
MSLWPMGDEWWKLVLHMVNEQEKQAEGTEAEMRAIAEQISGDEAPGDTGDGDIALIAYVDGHKRGVEEATRRHLEAQAKIERDTSQPHVRESSAALIAGEAAQKSE